MASGLTVPAMVCTIGGKSVFHISPAITVAMPVDGKVKVKDAWIHILAQCVGAVKGAGLPLVVASGIDFYDIDVNGLPELGSL